MAVYDCFSIYYGASSPGTSCAMSNEITLLIKGRLFCCIFLCSISTWIWSMLNRSFQYSSSFQALKWLNCSLLRSDRLHAYIDLTQHSDIIGYNTCSLPAVLPTQLYVISMYLQWTAQDQRVCLYAPFWLYPYTICWISDAVPLYICIPISYCSHVMWSASVVLSFFSQWLSFLSFLEGAKCLKRKDNSARWQLRSSVEVWVDGGLWVLLCVRPLLIIILKHGKEKIKLENEAHILSKEKLINHKPKQSQTVENVAAALACQKAVDSA